MTYPYSKLLRHITDIRYIPGTPPMQLNLAAWDPGSPEKIEIHIKDMRGNPEIINVLDFNGTDLYNFIQEVYDMGKRDARQKIKDALEGR